MFVTVFRRWLACCWLVSLLVCSCATPYQPLKQGYGYIENQLNADEYEIRFFGNGNDTYDRAFDFAMLRGAEIALQKEAKSLVISDVVNLSSARKYESPRQHYYYQTASPYLSTGGNVVPSEPEFLDGTSYSYLVEVQPQQRVFYRPAVQLRISLSSQPATGNAYDPVKLRAQVRQKYALR